MSQEPDTDELAWARRMAALEDERGPLLPNGAAGGRPRTVLDAFPENETVLPSVAFERCGGADTLASDWAAFQAAVILHLGRGELEVRFAHITTPTEWTEQIPLTERDPSKILVGFRRKTP